MSHKEEKMNQFMEALGDIDPKYVEEARQAVSPEAAKKRSSCRYFASIRQWNHSPAARILATACLILVIAYGARKAGILSSITFSGDSAESSLNQFRSDLPEPDSQLSEELEELNSKDDPNTSNNSIIEDSSQNDSSNYDENENSPAAEDAILSSDEDQQNESSTEKDIKEETAAVTASKPPILTLYTSNKMELSNPDEKNTNSVDIQSNDYSWSYGLQSDARLSSFSNGTDEWNLANMTAFSLSHGSMISLDFNGIEPDSVSVRCIPASEAKKANREELYLELTAEEDGSFQLPEEEESYLVEIKAVWYNKHNNSYEGNCTYYVKVNFQN